MSAADGGSAFPHDEMINYETSRGTGISTGLSIRDYFAAKVIHALILREPADDINPETSGAVWCTGDSNDPDSPLRALTCRAYIIADAMRIERSDADSQADRITALEAKCALLSAASKQDEAVRKQLVEALEAMELEASGYTRKNGYALDAKAKCAAALTAASAL